MNQQRDISYYGARLFTLVGLLLILLAAYIAGTDRMTCVRRTGVDCEFVNSHWLDLRVVGRKEIRGVVGLFVRTSTERAADQTFERTTEMSTNETLVLRTRQGVEVDTLGGEVAGRFGEQIADLMRGTGPDSISVLDSYWPVSAVCFALGLGFVIFGGFAMRQP